MPPDRLGPGATVTYKSLERQAKEQGVEDGVGVAHGVCSTSPTSAPI